MDMVEMESINVSLYPEILVCEFSSQFPFSCPKNHLGDIRVEMLKGARESSIRQQVRISMNRVKRIKELDLRDVVSAERGCQTTVSLL
jgi:hypothetical protein